MPTTQRPWLARIHQQRRAHTLDLVRRAVADLQREHLAVTITAIVTASRKVDPDGKGISHSALLSNAGARDLYEEHRAWRPRKPRRHPAGLIETQLPTPAKLDRNPSTTRQRLGRLTKAQLIDRLLIAERAYAALYRCSMRSQARALEEEWDALEARRLSTFSRDKAVDKGSEALTPQRARRANRT